MKRTCVALDIETTGVDPERDAIIEVGAVKFGDGEVSGTWSSLVNPNRSLPYNIQRLTGISQADVDSALPLASILQPLSRFVGSCPVVGHNVGFDLAFLSKHGLLLDNAAFDTRELASILMLYLSDYTLANLAELLGVSYEERHRALPDAMAAKEVFCYLQEKATRLDLATIREINRLASGSDWALAEFFRELEREMARLASPSIRGRLAAKGELGPLFARARPKRLKPTKSKKSLDVKELSSMLEEGGLVSRGLSNYEYRPQQVEMLKVVAEAFNRGEYLFIEAGTGVGKSLAYLLPAVHFAVGRGEHVVISTNTINLQDQLFKKDIPFVREVLPLDFEAAVLKGRSNYLCLRKLTYLRQRKRLSAKDLSLLAKILSWLPGTVTGDRAELSLKDDEEGAWLRISAEEPCQADDCPHFKDCYFYHARWEAEAAHLVVVNHSLLVSDLLAENRVLPEHSYLIIDEAHHLEDRATEQLEVEVSQRGLAYLLERLIHPRWGIVGRLPREIEGEARLLAGVIEQLKGNSSAFFGVLAAFLAEHSSGNKEYDERVRIGSAIRAQPGWAQVEIAWEPLDHDLAVLIEGLERLSQRLSDGDLAVELAETEMESKVCKEALHHVIVQPPPGYVFWATISAEDGSIYLHQAPLYVGDILREKLFLPKECVVLTSATLKTAGSFDFLRQRLGLEEAGELALGSPFDYASSTFLFIPTDLPEPNTPGYVRAAQKAILELCLAAGGRTLVLFTSTAQLRGTHEALARPLEEEGIRVLGQGMDGSRHQVLQAFRTHPQSVLLGTKSFWEGIDVMGDALSCLVIARLPFPVPDEPVFEARSEGYEDPFGQYAVPLAVLRFRQGFGRLIRSKSDRGAVVVLDRRISTKNYGLMFLESLPECTVREGPIAEGSSLIKEWLSGVARTSSTEDT